MAIKITMTNTAVAMRSVEGKILRRAADELRVVQKEQVASAFRNSGQPGEKWKPLWADKFVGNVSVKTLGKLGKAHGRLVRLLNRDTFTPSQITAVIKAKSKVDDLKAKATRATSYRKGGKPLQDTGRLAASFFTKYHFVFESEGVALIVLASSDFTAQWHQRGFSTRGPNFIPLTMKAKREHVRGANPKHEGLELGVDYIMAWKGVKIPARPMIDYADPANKKQITDTINAAMKRG